MVFIVYVYEKRAKWKNIGRVSGENHFKNFSDAN